MYTGFVGNIAECEYLMSKFEKPEVKKLPYLLLLKMECRSSFKLGLGRKTPKYDQALSIVCRDTGHGQSWWLETFR